MTTPPDPRASHDAALTCKFCGSHKIRPSGVCDTCDAINTIRVPLIAKDAALEAAEAALGRIASRRSTKNPDEIQSFLESDNHGDIAEAGADMEANFCADIATVALARIRAARQPNPNPVLVDPKLGMQPTARQGETV